MYAKSRTFLREDSFPELVETKEDASCNLRICWMCSSVLWSKRAGRVTLLAGWGVRSDGVTPRQCLYIRALTCVSREISRWANWSPSVAFCDMCSCNVPDTRWYMVFCDWFTGWMWISALPVLSNKFTKPVCIPKKGRKHHLLSWRLQLRRVNERQVKCVTSFLTVSHFCLLLYDESQRHQNAKNQNSHKSFLQSHSASLRPSTCDCKK